MGGMRGHREKPSGAERGPQRAELAPPLPAVLGFRGDPEKGNRCHSGALRPQAWLQSPSQRPRGRPRPTPGAGQAWTGGDPRRSPPRPPNPLGGHGPDGDLPLAQAPHAARLTGSPRSPLGPEGPGLPCRKSEVKVTECTPPFSGSFGSPPRTQGDSGGLGGLWQGGVSQEMRLVRGQHFRVGVAGSGVGNGRVGGGVEAEVRGQGSEARTHVPSVLSGISRVSLLTHRPPSSRWPLGRTAGQGPSLPVPSAVPGSPSPQKPGLP